MCRTIEEKRAKKSFNYNPYVNYALILAQLNSNYYRHKTFSEIYFRVRRSVSNI
jgi:hypothetical protein